MNVKEYISSGIIESYVLGIATEAEREEFEGLCALHPEIAEARNNFELSLESHLLENSIAPPAGIKEKIVHSLDSSANESYPGEFTRKETPVRSISTWRWIAAASIILLAGAAYWAVTTNNRYQQLQQANIVLRQQLQQSAAQMDSIKSDEEMLHKPEVKMAALHSPQNSTMYATIYWDTTSKDVYLLVNNMPQPATDKQYQLWALLDGKPIDLGLLASQKRLLLRMKNVQNAQAFAITLEPKGGSPAPTSNPVVMSKL